MANTEYMLSTIDNPYNPFDDFLSWFMYDVEKQHNTCGILARVLYENSNINLYANDLTEKEINDEVDKAIDTLIATDPLGLFIRVERKQSD